jgi:hypothetical protein
MTVSEITGNTSVAEVVKRCPIARRIFDRHGLKGCGGELGPSEPLAFFAAVHQANLNELLREINAEMENPSGMYVYKETLQATSTGVFSRWASRPSLALDVFGARSICFKSHWGRVSCSCAFCPRSTRTRMP